MKKILVLLLLLVPLYVNAIEVSDGEKLEEVTLDKCIDGNSANFKKQDGTIIPIRFLAIDAPEVSYLTDKREYYGIEASEYTCNTLTEATKIILEYDEKGNSEDSNGRILAWVFVDDSLLEEKLVESGYAKVSYLYDDYKYTAGLKEKEELAKTDKLGLWGEEDEVEVETGINEASNNDSSKDTSNKTGGLLNKIIETIKDIFNSMLAAISDVIDSFLNNKAG